jgi:DNA polymerase III delta prime subunit
VSGASDRQKWTSAILRVLAELAPEHQRSRFDVSGSGPTEMVWLGLVPPPAAERVPLDPSVTERIGHAFSESGVTDPSLYRVITLPGAPGTERLARYDAMTPAVANVSYGCVWASGTIPVDGEPTRIVRPLVSCTAHLRPGRFGTRLLYRDEWNLWPLLVDHQVAERLEHEPVFDPWALRSNPSPELLRRFTRLTTWTNDVLAASGLAPIRELSPPRDPREAPTDRLEIVVGWGCFTEGSADLLRPREALTSWSADPATARTAFASLYLGPPAAPPTRAPAGPPPPPEPLRTALPLTAAQEQAARRAQREPVAVVSGPPGTGKSQTAVAIASDAVARGESVLVATQSPMAADVLASLLDHVPGPTPVLFGGGRRANELASKLSDGLDAPPDEGATARWEARRRELDDLAAAVHGDLADVAAAQRWASVQLTADVHRSRAPRLFDPGTDPDQVAALLAEAHRLLATIHDPDDGWWADRRRRSALDDLRELVGATGDRSQADRSQADRSLADLEASVAAAEARIRALRAQDRDLHVADARWVALVEAEEALRHARGTRIANEVGRRAGPDARRHVAALAAALRTGRARRRAHLERVDLVELTRALPLWIGTLGEIEALLPATAAAFDLVILDEASMIDQGSAAAALLRAGRGVVIGDPRQLRFVSFTADADVDAAVTAHDCEPIADRLDVRRLSAFDLAAGVSPVTFLDEHFRSVPHLIGFSAERFYEGRLQVATRHPANDDAIAIDVVHVGGERDASGVNGAEVAAAVEQVQRLLDQTTGTVGVISPHRAQVDALRTAVADAVGPDVWSTGRLRVATVHGFQGSECDAVVASFGLSGDGGRGRAFLQDPNLFNVLVTRARTQMVVLASVDDVPPGLLADYLRWAERAPVPLPDRGADDDWTAQLGSLVADQGLEVRLGYRVGTWTVDLVVGDGPHALAVATRVHPDGPLRHVQRHLALHRSGWHQEEAFPTTDPGAAARLALDLAAEHRELARSG